MFAVELYAKIRRSVITKMLQFSIPPGYRRCERPASKEIGPNMERHP
jgi:hypothetical protein